MMFLWRSKDNLHVSFLLPYWIGELNEDHQERRTKS